MRPDDTTEVMTVCTVDSNVALEYDSVQVSEFLRDVRRTGVNQITIRDLNDDLARAIRDVAHRDGTSLNNAALKLLEIGAGVSPSEIRQQTIGSSLDHLIGSWSAEEAAEFDAALEYFEAVDETAWQ